LTPSKIMAGVSPLKRLGHCATGCLASNKIIKKLIFQKSSKKMSAGTSPKKEASSPPVPPIENGESAAQVVEEKTAFSLDNLRLHFEACLGKVA
jgi:hypothetical protein